MLIYRYEMLDGGGPYCTRDGKLRSDLTLQMNDPWLYGCVSLESLVQYWKQQNVPELLKDCTIKIYDIPEEQVHKGTRQVIFPKTYFPIN